MIADCVMNSYFSHRSLVVFTRVYAELSGLIARKILYCNSKNSFIPLHRSACKFKGKSTMESTTNVIKTVSGDDEAPKILRILATAVSMAEFADKMIKEIMSKGKLGIVDKGRDDLQTEVDRSVQAFIQCFLSKRFPNINIIAEEELPPDYDFHTNVDWESPEENPDVLAFKEKCPAAYHDIKEEDVVVWVDPLDGTFEFTEGFLDHVTVLIGIAVDGVALGGVIHQPFYKKHSDGSPEHRTLWALRDVGYGGFEPVPAPEDKLIVTVTKSHSDKLLEAALIKLKPDEILRVGGAGHKVLLILDGRAHAYIVPSKGLKRWDSCAPEAILEAVGGLVTDTNGNHYSYDKNIPFSNDNGLIAVFDKEKQKIFIDLFKKE